VLLWSAVSLSQDERAGAPGEVANGDIVFTCAPAGYEGEYSTVLCRMAPDGSGLRELTEPGNLDRDPEWSPDGTRIVFTRGFLDDDPDGFEAGSTIMVIDESGEEHAIPPLGPGQREHPTWAPDGKSIAFVATTHIYTVNIDGSNLRHLSTEDPEDGEVYELNPSWSPDGSSIAYAYMRDHTRDDPPLWIETINVIDVDGTGTHPITDPELMAVGPEWSPDGTQIAFTRSASSSAGSSVGDYSDYDDDIYLINVDGTGLRRLEVDRDSGWVWSPDGTKILFGHKRGFYILELETGAVSFLTAADTEGGTPTWQPVLAPVG